MCSSLPETTTSVLCEPFQESWTSTDLQYLNGKPDACAQELLINQEQEPEQLIVTHKGRETTDGTDTWEQIIWPVHTQTPLSFATVQWDLLNPSSTPLVTDSMLANQTDSGPLTQTDITSFPIHSEDVNTKLFKEAEKEEQDEFDSWLLLCSESEWTGNNLKPRETESIRAQTTQEEEHSTHMLLESNIDNSLRPCFEEERHTRTVETEDFIRSCLEIQLTGFVEDSIEYLRLEEEPDILLTGQTDLEEQTTLVNGDGIAEGDQGEEQIVTNEEATAASHLSVVEVFAEPLRTDLSGLSINPEELIELQKLLDDLLPPEQTETEEEKYTPEQLHEDPVEEPDICKEVNQDEKLEPSDADEQTGVNEVTIQAAESTEQANSPETLNLQTDWSGMKCDQIAYHEGEFEQNGSNQIQTQPQHEDLPQPIAVFIPEEVGIDITDAATLSWPTPPEMPAKMKITEPLRGEDDEISDLGKEADAAEIEPGQAIVANGEQSTTNETVKPHMNGGEVDREAARRLAEKLFKLDGVQRVDVVKHIDKDNNFSHAVGEEYLKFFDFTGQTLDQALRSFLNVVVLIGETQERERVLQHFSCRFHESNPDSFSSPGAVLALTCAMMLLNTDLHGQNVGKSMSSSKFVSNLDGMNEGENFNKDLLKSLYSSIKTEPLQWALSEEELKSSVLEDIGEDTPLRSKANPFLDVPHDKNAIVIKEGFLQRKLHADVDGKRTPRGKRGWKIVNAVLRGMVLYFQKDNYRKEVVSVHHSLAEEATDYTKRSHVFRLQTADWRVFLFQASSKAEMNSWVNRINLVSALHSSPPFPAAVGSQRRFCRPILPASQSANTLERQLQSYAGMLESFGADLSHLHQNPPDGRRAKARDLEEQRLREEYLQHEICRYEAYIQGLEAWRSVNKSGDGTLNTADLNLFDKVLCAEDLEAEMEEGGLKKSHSSPSLELELAAPAVVKVRRNISERRTYRKPVIPRWNKEA